MPSADSSPVPNSTRISKNLLVRHEESAPRERSTCGWRHLLVSRQDTEVAAWAHAVDIDGARLHYHKLATELYYVLEGEGTVLLDGKREPVKKAHSSTFPPASSTEPKAACESWSSASPTSATATSTFPKLHRRNRQA